MPYTERRLASAGVRRYGLGPGHSSEHPPGSGFPSTSALRALAPGREDPALVEQLRIRQRGTRLLALSALLSRADLLGHSGPDRLPMAPQVRALFMEADRADPEAVTVVLLHPSVGRWLSKALRTPDQGPVPGGPSGPWSADHDLHAVAAAAAIRAGLAFTLPLPVRDGFAVLPTLGSADLRTADSATAHITVSPDRAEIKCGEITVRLSQPGGSVPPGWIPAQSVCTPVRSRSFDLVPDDMDPYRETDGPVPPSRLSLAETDRWRQLAGEAQRLLVGAGPRQATIMAVALTALTPRPAEPGGVMTSISGSDAFGGVVLNSPPDAVELAATLVHEFRHMKLNAVLDAVDLYEEEEDEGLSGSLYYAPWRDDPRPLHGLFHGVFAFFGVVDFWRGLIQHTEGETLRRSQFQLAYWRRQTSDAYTTLRTSPQLTANGRLFVAMMSHAPDGWTDPGSIPGEVAALAEEAVLAHRARWRLHHLRPEAAVAAAELAEAWSSGGPQPPTPPNPHIA
ncbi:HEXXH motif domain-containing protein [Streptomyces sp. NPDC002812]|uniref:HEXXH motif domain-containing protein n=1 Tax=Streptomyces sp. NPDC002812 TaxID=3154434 RepID=UPI00331F0D54